MSGLLCMLFYVHLFCVLWIISGLEDTITPTLSLSDGKTLVSKHGRFELGFFSPGSSKSRYLGIWYKNIPVRTVVWVANRQSPLKDFSGTLMFNKTGNLVLVSDNDGVVWSSNAPRQVQNPLAQLLDSGNLVIKEEKDVNSEAYVWQSFDYPCDTLLPGMKLGWDLRVGLNRQLSSWKNSEDPSPGDLTLGIELHESPGGVMLKGSKKYFRSGPWNGLQFSGIPTRKPSPLSKLNFISNEEEVYYTYQFYNESIIASLVLNQTTSLAEVHTWKNAEQTWQTFLSWPLDNCDYYGVCGANGICGNAASSVCQCLMGFKPKSPEGWKLLDWSQGCIRDKPLDCQSTEGFNKFVGLKLPDTTNSWLDKSMNFSECKDKCLKNCSCMAYTNSDIRRNGSGCVLWFGDLIDIRQFPIGGDDLYIRMSVSNLGKSDPREAKDGTKWIIPVTIVGPIAVISGILLVIYYIWKGRTTTKEGPEEDLDLPSFDLPAIFIATDNFSINKKLGEGGFGPVYKGTLVDGPEIAVKRLSKSSRQGLIEFKNEVILIAKLQHRNLVKLLGYCNQGEEKMLIYEYLPNRSLDSYIFDEIRGKLLNWSKRFHILRGIARGLLYLHQDSRLRIIHRDLKASNVLLDNELNPKISDFGLARIFGDQSEENTTRVVGTYGYMAPEYAIYGMFSVKSDVFSFGVLLLEIVSGKKNRGHHLILIELAWKLWTEERALELIDTSVKDSCLLPEIFRCIHVGLLCVQQLPDDRPDMLSVVLMLSGESALPQPKKPGFLKEVQNEAHPSSSKHESCSANGLTITLLEAR